VARQKQTFWRVWDGVEKETERTIDGEMSFSGTGNHIKS
jgi:hypothetical protein